MKNLSIPPISVSLLLQGMLTAGFCGLVSSAISILEHASDTG